MIRFGIDILLDSSPTWKTDRIGLVTNHAATTNRLVSSRQALGKHGFNIQKLFSPEHGLDVLGADGHAMKDGADGLTGLPIISLYSNKLAPSEEDLSDIDLVLFDIPDIGSRFYTYLWTMTYVMEACASSGKKLVILDRPNPISGMSALVEGPIVAIAQSSFIGRWPIPIRHSCTLGELALYFNTVRDIKCQLEVIKCEGWNRTYFQPDWGMPFVPTSPAIRHFESMLLYPGLCLLEATNISEGRGTKDAFCIVGAPWINGEILANRLSDIVTDELQISSYRFTPIENKYQGQECKGIRIAVKQPAFFQPVFFGLMLIKLIAQLYPAHFQWSPYPTLVNQNGRQHLDKLLGIPNSELLFELPLPTFIAEITKLTKCSEWNERVEQFLLYLD